MLKLKTKPKNVKEAIEAGWKTLIDYKGIDCCPSINCLEVYEKKFGKENEKKGLATKINGFTYYRPDVLKNVSNLVSQIEIQVSDLVKLKEKQFKEISETFGDDIYRFFYWRNRDKFIEYELGNRNIYWINLDDVIDEFKDDPGIEATYKRELDRVDWISFFKSTKFVKISKDGKVSKGERLKEGKDWEIHTNFRDYINTPEIWFNSEYKQMVKDTIDYELIS